MNIVCKYYEFMVKEVDIVGIFKCDLFVIECMEDGCIWICVYDINSKFEKEFKFYDCIFFLEEIYEIVVYGLMDQDVFWVKGICKCNCIKVCMVGGVGQDIFEDELNGKGLIYYDVKNEGNLFQIGFKVKVKRCFDFVFNIYDCELNDYNFNYIFFLFVVGFNLDDGIFFGLSVVYIIYGFKKDFYVVQYKIDMKFVIGMNGFMFDYQGEFIDFFGLFEFGFDVEY